LLTDRRGVNIETPTLEPIEGPVGAAVREVHATDAASVRLHPTFQVIDLADLATAVSDYRDGSRLRFFLLLAMY
jgi:hypothetical protein